MLMLLSLLLISYAVGNIRCSTVPGNSTDMLWLLDFKAVTNDPGQILSSWNTSIPHCQWEGVNCSLTHPGRVMVLNLTGQNLQGQIAPSLGNLTFLRTLDLSSNGFFGQLPTLNRLHRLQNLFLSDNKLDGFNPDALTNCSNLEYLDLSVNQLQGSIPTSILNHSTLAVLDLHSNFLQMELPSNIGNTLPSLQALSLHHNMFQGHIPASLGNAPFISIIDLTSNNFSGQVPSSLGRLSYLEHLKLEGNKLEANDSKSWEFLDALSNCTSLKFLLLNDNQLQGAIPNSIGNLSPNLTFLALRGNKLSGTVPGSIGNLTGLTWLHLGQNNLTGPIGAWIGNLKKLGLLRLSENNFAGPIPSSIGGLTKLTRLLLYGNNFEGPIPPSLGNLRYLSDMNLSHNNLNGHIPGKLFSPVSTMTKCVLSYNNLEGPLPPEISNLQQLTELHLSSNKLSGEIPATLGECQQLQILKMDSNFLTGNIPKSLSSLKSLSMVNLSHNILSGFIPTELSYLPFLTQLDLSYNSLQGEIPRGGVLGNATAVSLGGNWGLCGGVADLHKPLCPGVSQRSETEYYLIRALIPIFGFTSLIMLTYFIILGKKTSRGTYLQLLSFGKHFPRVSYNDLARATGNFSQSNLIGRGSYGSVYRGKLTQAKMQVAIKVLDLEMRCANRRFISECEALRSIRHRNLIPILTSCSTIDNVGNAFKALIYEFMPNGNLDTWLHKKSASEGPKSLDLGQRISMAVNIADALAYLHHDIRRSIVHCDLKPSNILLDVDMNAYLGDFGIANLVHNSKSTSVEHSSLSPSSDSSIGLKGTIGYIAPEYAQTGQASTCLDVYSFGIVLLEMLTGKRPTDSMFDNELNIVNFTERNFPDQILHIIDAHLQEECKGFIRATAETGNVVNQCLLSLVQVALSCTRLFPRERMNMREVASKLHATRTSYVGTTKREQVMPC